MFESSPPRTAPRTAPRSVIDVALAGLLALDGPVAAHPGDLEAVLRRAPGPGLAAGLETLEVTDVDDATLVEAVAGWERLASWAAGRQAQALRELSRRREASLQDRFVADEVAARLAITRSAAQAKVGLALRMGSLPQIEDALVGGRLDVRKAGVLADETAHMPERTARDVVAAVLEDTSRRTAPQIRARIRRLELAQDPAAGEARHARCRADRHVAHDPAPDGMAWVTAYLPADDAMTLWTTLCALADTAEPADPRPVGARRADALVDLAARVLDSGLTADGTALRRRGGRPAHLEVHASATSLLGLDDAPAELVGHGPIPASMAQRIADRSTWAPLLVDADSGRPLARAARSYRPSAALADAVVARDRTCTFLGCRTPARSSDLDHVEPFTPGRPASRQTTAENLQALCRHHHLAKTHGGWEVHRDLTTDRTHWRAPTGHTYTTDPPPALVHGAGQADDRQRHHPLSGQPPSGQPPSGHRPSGPPPSTGTRDAMPADEQPPPAPPF